MKEFPDVSEILRDRLRQSLAEDPKLSHLNDAALDKLADDIVAFARERAREIRAANEPVTEYIGVATHIPENQIYGKVHRPKSGRKATAKRNRQTYEVSCGRRVVWALPTSTTDRKLACGKCFPKEK